MRERAISTRDPTRTYANTHPRTYAPDRSRDRAGDRQRVRETNRDLPVTTAHYDAPDASSAYQSVPSVTNTI